MRRVIRIVQAQREARYGLLRGYFHGADDDTAEEIEQERLKAFHCHPTRTALTNPSTSYRCVSLMSL